LVFFKLKQSALFHCYQLHRCSVFYDLRNIFTQTHASIYQNTTGPPGKVPTLQIATPLLTGSHRHSITCARTCNHLTVVFVSWQLQLLCSVREEKKHRRPWGGTGSVRCTHQRLLQIWNVVIHKNSDINKFRNRDVW